MSILEHFCILPQRLESKASRITRVIKKCRYCFPSVCLSDHNITELLFESYLMSSRLMYRSSSNITPSDVLSFQRNRKQFTHFQKVTDGKVKEILMFLYTFLMI